MTADALSGDRLITLALLRPGWESDYEGRPAVFPVVCVGRIVAEKRLPDGRFNILLRGMSRARVRRELPPEKLYRVAEVELLQEGPSPSAQPVHTLRQQLAQAAPSWLPQGAAAEPLKKLLQTELPLGVFCDMLAFALSLPIESKQQLLEELNPEQRARMLLGLLSPEPILHMPTPVERKFPPDFSSN
jgi:Lon protease-like protein